MQTENATPYREQVMKLLKKCNLPYEDLPADMSSFLVIERDGRVVGCAGVEVYGRYGLLRSVAVDPILRGLGLAGELLTGVEQLAAEKDIAELYLLTETAPKYFGHKGFSTVERDSVPEEIRQSGEFAHVCPQSAIVMKKILDKK